MLLCKEIIHQLVFVLRFIKHKKLKSLRNIDRIFYLILTCWNQSFLGFVI